MERTSRKYFRYGSEDHLIAKFLNPPRDNEKRIKQVCCSENINLACYNGKKNSDIKIYASMACMSGNDEFPSENSGDSWQCYFCHCRMHDYLFH